MLSKTVRGGAEASRGESRRQRRLKQSRCATEARMTDKEHLIFVATRRDAGGCFWLPLANVCWSEGEKKHMVSIEIGLTILPNVLARADKVIR